MTSEVGCAVAHQKCCELGVNTARCPLGREVNNARAASLDEISEVSPIRGDDDPAKLGG